MGFIDKYTKSTKHNGQSQKTQKGQYAETNSAQALDANLNPPKASEPIKEQAKQKLTTTAYFKSIYSKDGLFDKKFNNLDMNNLKYVFDRKSADDFMAYNGTNDIKSSEFSEFSKKVKESLPDKMVGIGENEPILVDKIDFKKVYNSEAKALISAYYSNENNIKDTKKFLYSIAATYAFPNARDLDTLKKETDKIDFAKLNNEEIRLEFQKLFNKVNEHNIGKMKFINSIVERLDNVEKKVKNYTDAKMENITDKYAKMFEEETKKLFSINEEEGEVYINELQDNLDILTKALKPNQKLNELEINENTPEGVVGASKYVKSLEDNNII